MICPNCQNKISKDDEFCGYCGRKTEKRLTELKINAEKESQKYKDREQLNEGDATKLKGLGGWLILVGIGLFISLVYRFYGFFESISMFSDKDISVLSNQSSEFYVTGLNILLKFELLMEIVMGIAVIYLIYLFFSKKIKFPYTYIILLVTFLVLSIIDIAWSYSLKMPTVEMQKIYSDELDASLIGIAREFLPVIIWVLYMIKSKRVKATFVE